MADNDTTNNAQADQQPPQPNPDLKSLDRLVGTWEMSGEVQGRVSFEWMEGGFFLIQHVDLEQYGQRIKGIEIIGHERPFGSEPSEEIKSRFYSSAVMGDISWDGTVPTDLVGRVTTESLVLVGGASPEWMIDVSNRVADALPNGQHAVLDGQEHVVPPEVLVPVLKEFFAGLKST